MGLRNEERAVKYLVTEKDGTTHLPYTGSDGKPNPALMSAAWAALHGGHRGKKYAGPDKAGAIERLKEVYKAEKMDLPDEKKSFADGLEELRGLLTSATGAVLPESFRALSQEQQDCLALMQQCRAACYAVMSYLSYMPYGWDGMPEGGYSAFWEGYQCCDLCIGLVGRESPLTPAAFELCAAACRECAIETEDAILKACAVVASATADACDKMAAPGEGEEGRRAKDHDEVRTLKCELRSDGSGRKIVGYPIVFNQLSQDLGGFRERVLPDAVVFDDDVRADFNHDANCILGRSSAGTLRLTVDTKGVRMEADAPETSWANDLLVSIDRGDIDQGSFAFRVLPGGQSTADESGEVVRTLSKILVRKVSVVSDPAYLATRIELRNLPAAPPPASLPSPTLKLRLVGMNLDLLEREA